MKVVAQGQITLSTVKDGSGYSVNIKGGIRGIAYAADGSNPDPSIINTAYSVELLKDGKSVTPYSYKWTSGGNLSGTASTATFKPTISKNFISGDTYVSVEVKPDSSSQAIIQTVSVVSSKFADGLDWIADWNSNQTTVKGDKVISPKIFAGTNSGSSLTPNLTGVALGRDVLSGSTSTIGIVGYKNNLPVFKLDQNANFLVSKTGNSGDVINGTSSGIYFDGNELNISGKVRIKSGSYVGKNSVDIDSVVSNAQDAKDKIDNLKVGGRNLAMKATIDKFGNTTVDLDGYSSNGTIVFSRATGDGNGGFCFDRLIKYKPDSKYVVSFRMKLDSGTISNIYFHNGQGFKNTAIYIDGTKVGAISSNITTSVFADKNFHIVTMEYTTPSTLVDSSTGTNKTYFQPNKGLTTTVYGATIEEFKVEEGNIVTAWTVPQEDVDQSIQEVQSSANSAQQAAESAANTANSVSSTVSSILVPGNEVLIDGGKISAGTITSNSIKTGSFTIRNEALNRDTFSIDANGDVKINGTLQSDSFDLLNGLGYRMTPDGKAILNQAVVRGDVILPNAGITNYGAIIGNENLLQTTDYEVFSIDEVMNGTTNWQKATLMKASISTYAHSNGKAEDAHIKSKKVLNCSFDLSTGITQGYMNPRGVGFNGNATTEYIELMPNTKYTFSGWIYQGGDATGSCTLNVWGYNDDGSNRTTLVSTTLTNTWKGCFTFVEYTFTTDSRKYYQPRIYLNRKSGVETGVVQVLFYNMKLERGEISTPYCPSSKDELDYVRLWAGSSYEGRSLAPFRVTQNGDMFATNATLSGRLVGAVDAGMVHIHDDEIVINSTSTYMTDAGEILSIEPLDSLPNPHLRLGAGQSFINTDFVFGSIDDKKIIFSNSNRTISLNKMKVNVSSASSATGVNVVYDPAGNWYDSFKLLDPNGGSWVTMGYSGGVNLGTLWVTHQGAKGLNSKYGDIAFRSRDINDDVDVTVQGNLMVRNTITSSKQNIEMRSVSDEGWGFFAT